MSRDGHKHIIVFGNPVYPVLLEYHHGCFSDAIEGSEGLRGKRNDSKDPRSLEDEISDILHLFCVENALGENNGKDATGLKEL